jgi:cellobiose phosphorylase
VLVADIVLSATVSRTLLGLPDLEIGHGDRYYLSPQFLGANLQWTRQQAASPFMDGQVTTQRTRQNVTETVGVEIKADTAADLQAYTAELIQAFVQDSFVLTVTADGATFAYRCEAADYQVASWSTPRMVSKQGQVLFQMQRQPVALVGGY